MSCNCLGAVRNPGCPEHSPADVAISYDDAGWHMPHDLVEINRLAVESSV